MSANATIPVYDIRAISRNEGRQDILVEALARYVERHYQKLRWTHRHSFYHFVLFTKGSGHHLVDFVRYEVKPYQLYFMSPGQVHSWEFEGDTEGYLVHFESRLFSSLLQDNTYLERFPFFTGEVSPVCQLSGDSGEKCVSLLAALLEEYEGRAPHRQHRICLLLLEIFILAHRSVDGLNVSAISGKDHDLLRRFRQLIEKHYKELRLPAEYAALLHVTANHLNAVCRRFVDKTAGELIRDRVVLEAKRLLANVSLRSNGIAGELNFSDNSYFSRFFKKSTGQTPEEFRKNFINQ